MIKKKCALSQKSEYNFSYEFQMNLMLRIVAHLFISLIFGYLYRDVGNDASKLLSNMVFVYGTNLFLVYTGQMAVIVSCEYIIILSSEWPSTIGLPHIRIST